MIQTILRSLRRTPLATPGPSSPLPPPEARRPLGRGVPLGRRWAGPQLSPDDVDPGDTAGLDDLNGGAPNSFGRPDADEG